MNRSLVVFLFLLVLLPCRAFADKETGEGYAQPTFRELYQTIVLDGGMDINDINVANEYARLTHCDLYRDHFKDDVVWHKVRSQIVSRIVEKKEYYRALYETVGVFKLDRYNFDDQYFPVSADTAMKNVGTIVLFAPDEFQPYCGLSHAPEIFPPNVYMVLTQPLTVDKVKIPSDKVQRILTRMQEMRNPERLIYVRIRMLVTDAPGVVVFGGKAVRAEVRGNVTAVDFFLDKEMTEPIGGGMQSLK